MISVKVKGPEGEDYFIYYVPEFCTLNGINENDIENYKFMNNLSKYTKLKPDEKIKQIEKCLDLFKDITIRKPKEDKKEDKKEEKKEETKEEKKKR